MFKVSHNSTDNRNTRQRTTGNWQEARSNKPRRSSWVYLTFYIFVQQEEVWKFTKIMRMGPQD